ncbi:MAG: methyltransferase domain-containing protein, partial [Ignavibacteriae bacterium]|nr:methyltransferase domain-containing protein [Ignavibacteriota bacterium]
MALVTPTTNKEELRERILSAVQEMYAEVASCPTRGFHFPTGRTACEYVGYPEDELDAIPASAVESFAGVGYPFKANVIRRGDIVLDVGSGSGTDILITALKVGQEGKVHGLDMTPAMIEKANENISKARAKNIQILEGNAESIPLPDAMVDVITSNGVLNLVPDKEGAYREIFRVLKAGGHLQISDIVLSKDLSEKSRSDPQLWAECIVGAVTEENYLNLIRSVGFTDVRIIDTVDYFDRSPNPSTKNVARQYGATA